MATISNPTDPNKTVATSNVAPQPTSTSGTQTPTGQYSTLQKYLSANQGSGQRLAGAIGSNVNKEITGLKDSTGREINEAGAANKNISNLTGTTNKYTGDLKSANPDPGADWDKSFRDWQGRQQRPAIAIHPSNQESYYSNQRKTDLESYTKQFGARPGVPSGTKAYDVNSYATNLSGANAAADIAKDQTKLNTFRGIATGDTSSQLQKESNKQANEALNASAKAYDTNKERQSQLNNFGDRSALLQKAINSRNQRAGLQNLDNALLSQDKSGTLNQVNQNLQANTKGLQENKNVATAKQEEVGTLSTAQAAAELGLNNRLGDMNAEQQKALTDRVAQINKAKTDTKARMEADYKKFQDTGEISQALYDTLQLGNVQDVDAAAGISGGNPVAQKTTNPNETPQQKQIRLFNIIENSKDRGINRFLDTEMLDKQALTGQDVVNQQDMDNLNALAALTGGTNTAKLSQFGSDQIGESSLDEDLNKRYTDFVTKDLQTRKTGQGTRHEDIIKGNWFGGKDKVGDAFGSSAATATLQDYLYGPGIYRQTTSNESSAGINNLLGNVIQGMVNLNPEAIGNIATNTGNTIQAGVNAIQDPSSALLGIVAPTTAAWSEFLGNPQAKRVSDALGQAGYTANGTSARNFGGGERGAAQTGAEQGAVGQVQTQMEQMIKDIGYKNLLKLIQGEGGEY